MCVRVFGGDGGQGHLFFPQEIKNQQANDALEKLASGMPRFESPILAALAKQPSSFHLKATWKSSHNQLATCASMSD